jgi:hypothetical protein
MAGMVKVWEGEPAGSGMQGLRARVLTDGPDKDGDVRLVVETLGRDCLDGPRWDYCEDTSTTYHRVVSAYLRDCQAMAEALRDLLRNEVAEVRQAAARRVGDFATRLSVVVGPPGEAK